MNNNISPSKARKMSDDIYNHYMVQSAECNQISKMLGVQDRLLQEVLVILQKLEVNQETSEDRMRASILC